MARSKQCAFKVGQRVLAKRPEATEELPHLNDKETKLLFRTGLTITRIVKARNQERGVQFELSFKESGYILTDEAVKEYIG